MAWTDSQGKRLCDYEQPSVAVDIALLTLIPDNSGWRLALVVHCDDAVGWALPGVFLRIDRDETLAQASLRALETKAGVTGEDPQQLHVFDVVDRDPRGRVLSVAHVDLVPFDRLEKAVALFDVVGAPPRAELPRGQKVLPYDHDWIVERAVEWARQEYDALPDPRHLLPRKFTMYQLRRVHEAVLGQELDKDTFRRRWERLGLVERLEEKSMSSTVGREAHLYIRAKRGRSIGRQ